MDKQYVDKVMQLLPIMSVAVEVVALVLVVETFTTKKRFLQQRNFFSALIYNMFCLDFAFAFIVHGLIVKWSHSEHRFLQSSSRSPISLSNIDFTKLAFTFGLGGIAGFGSAVALYPFDIVRMSVLEKGSSHFAYSTIPYMSVYLGSYFMLRDERSSFGSKFLLANGHPAGYFSPDVKVFSDILNHDLASISERWIHNFQFQVSSRASPRGSPSS